MVLETTEKKITIKKYGQTYEVDIEFKEDSDTYQTYGRKKTEMLFDRRESLLGYLDEDFTASTLTKIP